MNYMSQSNIDYYIAECNEATVIGQLAREVKELRSNPIRIKPLSWRKGDDGTQWAYSQLTGNYNVRDYHNEFIAVGLGPFRTEEAAKAACNALHIEKIMREME